MKKVKKIELALPEVEQIEINGEVFDILKSGVDILNRTDELDKQYAKIKTGDKSPANIERIRLWANGVVNFIDEILGKGSVNKIAKGRPVKAEVAIEWLTAICKAMGQAADEKIEEHIAEKYE